LLPGDRLPGEEELCVQHHASRAAVREAMQSLKARGLVVSRRGSGSFVSDDALRAPLSASIDLYTALRREGAAFLELMELRQLIECASAEALAHPEKEKGRILLRQSLDRMKVHVSNLRQFAKCDIAFHLALVEGAGNELFATIMEGIMPGLGLRFAEATYNDPALPERILQEHSDICNHLDAGNSEAARKAVACHLTTSRRHLEDLLSPKSF
jgi:DNA-binding FadR family transcriptional regulator